MQRQREEKETLEANVREQVVSEMMEVISDMQNGFRYVSFCLSFQLSVKEISFKDDVITLKSYQNLGI